MLIKTKIYLSLLLAILATLILGLFIFQTSSDIERDNHTRTLIIELVKNIYERNVLTSDYILFASERSKTQWQIKHEEVDKILELLVTDGSWRTDELASLAVSYENLSRDFSDLSEKYSSLVAHDRDNEEVLYNKLSEIVNDKSSQDWQSEFINFLSTQSEKNSFGHALKDRLVSRILMESQIMVSDSFSLLEKIDDQIRSTQIKGYILGGLIVFLLLFIIIILFLLFYRGVVSPILKLFDGVNKISHGEYGYKFDIKRNDEIGHLALAFNAMSKAIEIDRKKIKEQTEIVVGKQKELEAQEEAILNVLEDVEQEKNERDYLVHELEKFKLAVREASDQIIITDINGKIIYVNKATEDITGYTADVMIGKTPALWGKQMPLEYYKKMWHTIKKEKKVFQSVVNNVRKGGQKYIADIHVVPILDDKKKILFFVGIERDITKEKEIDRSKTEFVSLASHQLRTPLAAISWYGEMLIKGEVGKLTADQKAYMEKIYISNERMIGLVGALLNVSRIELGTFMVEPKNCDLIGIVKSLIIELKPQITIKDIKFSTKYDPKLPQKIKLDDKLIRIVISNLISNAVKYTPPKGKVVLEIKKRNKDVEIIVSDNGYGIPKNQQVQIYKKLFRADNIKTKDTEGTGLGLYLVKSILDNTGGKVWFESIENKGTKFYVTIPLTGMKKKIGTKRLSWEG